VLRVLARRLLVVEHTSRVLLVQGAKPSRRHAWVCGTCTAEIGPDETMAVVMDCAIAVTAICSLVPMGVAFTPPTLLRYPVETASWNTLGVGGFCGVEP
jgi:hypothetical protein